MTQSGGETVVDLTQPRDAGVPSLFGTHKERVVSTQELDTNSVNNGPQPYPISKDGSHSSRLRTRRRSGPRRVQSLSVQREHRATHQPRHTDTHSGNDNTRSTTSECIDSG